MRVLRLFLWVIAGLGAMGGVAFAWWDFAGRTRPRAQTPQPPYPYLVEDISVTASDRVLLQGTLVVPWRVRSSVVLLGVAGPNDRDLSFRGHKSFAVIADHLARCGVASARFDDRGVGGAGGDWQNASYQRLTQDALEIVQVMRADPRLRDHPIGLAGLSEGSAIALLATAQSSDIDHLILMSPPGVSGEQALRVQFERLMDWSLIWPSARAPYRRLFDEFVRLVRGADDERGRAALARFLAGEGRALIPPYGFVPASIEGRVRLFSGAWYRSQLQFDPVPALRNLRGPVLVVSGERDQVLPPETHVTALQRALQGKAVEFVSIPGANHLLMPAWLGLPQEYARIETTIDRSALTLLCGWVQKIQHR